MKRIGLFVLGSLLSSVIFAQFNDDFTDGDFTVNPVWNGTTSKFIIAGNELQSFGNSGSADELYLTTDNDSVVNFDWTFDVNLTFNPSTSNYLKVYLVSDQSDLTGSLNGYYIRIGETGASDTFELFRQDGNTDVKLLTGQVNFTTSVNSRIKVTRNLSGVWEMFTDKGITGSFTSNGTVSDVTYTASSFFGVYCKYSTASRFDMFHFDNFNVQPIFVDVIPPSLQSVNLVSATELDVVFDESVESVSAQIIANYTVDNGIGGAISAILDGDGKTVHLTFATSFVNGNAYNVTATNIDDLAGNTLASDLLNFTYFIPSYRDIVITEIHPDPDVATSLPVEEFVELYNRSNSPIDLTGFTFSDATATTTLGSFILSSNSYVTLCSNGDTAMFSPFGDVLGVSSFPSLNNAGDDLSLKNAADELIDEVNYLDDWYNGTSTDGISLEIINPNHPCSLSSNWGPSIDGSGGTPSQQNSIFDNTLDSQAPEILSSQLLGDTAIEIFFTEPIDFSGGSISDFTINANTIVSVDVATGSTSIILNFGTNLTKNLLHTLVVSNITDCIGNVMVTESIEFGLGIEPEQFNVMITEIFADETPQVSLPLSEFVELFNNSDDIISLDGCYFTDFTDTLFLWNVNMLPKSYLILSDDIDYLSFGEAYISSAMPGINNAGEQLTLFSSSNQIIHAVNYSDDWYSDSDKDGGGWTLEMIDPDNYCGEESNWRASVDSDGGTPGKINSVDASNPDLTAPEMDRAIAVNTSLVNVYFNENMDINAMSTANFSINNGIVISGFSTLQDNKTIELSLSTALEEKVVYTVTVSGVTDCIGNAIDTDFNFAEFAIAEDPEIGDVIINEILFEPLSGGKDFVEFYNNSDKYIDLKDVFLLEYSADTIKNVKTIVTDYYVLAPKEYAWITEGIQDVIDLNSNAIEDNAILTDLPSYSNAEGTVAIGFYNDDSLVVADRFDYLDNYHYELLDDEKGVSLERVTFDGATNDFNNWHSASVQENYSTPGYQNSQQLNIGGIEDQITIFPEVFTPDEDGDKDYTTISYSFDDNGYTLSITIYDSHGRLISNLVRNDLVGREGFYQWDGIDDQNQKAGVGYYIVLIEVFDLEGNTNAFKKKVVVGARF